MANVGPASESLLSASTSFRQGRPNCRKTSLSGGAGGRPSRRGSSSFRSRRAGGTCLSVLIAGAAGRVCCSKGAAGCRHF